VALKSMPINRRVFFSSLLARAIQPASLRVAVLETFGDGQTSSAILVHHAEPASRDLFARWLQMHPKSLVRVRTENGLETAATIFRVRMCFGRGLILPGKPLQIHERDVLTLIV
jgi:hypothetical protein